MKGNIQPKISVVVPIHNEKANLRILDREIHHALRGKSLSYEVIYVDDGSTDGSTEVVRDLVEHNARKNHAIYLSRNFGQTAALKAGIKKSRGEILVPLDADLQNLPADIPRLVSRLEKGEFDLVSGWRRLRQDQVLTRNIPSWVANRLINFLFGIEIKDFGCSLKAYRSAYLKKIDLYGEMHRYIPILVHFQGGRITNEEVGHRKRSSGKTKYGLGRIPKVVLDLLLLKFLLDASHKPLHWFGGLGFLSFILSLGSGALAVYLRLAKEVSFILTPLPLLTVFSFITGLIFLSLGLLSEIMVRIYYGKGGEDYFQERITRGQ
ncbi:MAG: glycosyltransferase [Verrucomicrobia bacterium]|nr:glycosyltransferase [Verrucomicrobiota bacterium]